MIQHSYLSNADVDSIDSLYKTYQQNPENVDSGWRRFFEGFDLAYNQTGIDSETSSIDGSAFQKELKVLRLIEDFRHRGHFFTKTNPVRERRKYTPTLEIDNYGLQANDLEQFFSAGSELGLGKAKLKDIINHLETTYCQSIGVEYAYITDPEKRSWIQNKVETNKNTPQFSIEQKRLILKKLNEAVAFENFLHTKYIGQKRFSLEGLETLIPALDAVIEFGAELGVQEFIIGMAHRGRLNVLANILKKSYEEIFSEFEGKVYEDALFEGDVKYHLGYSSDVITSTKKPMRLTLSPNPSHLESVNPVVKGVSRAKLDTKYENNIDKIAPILIHGDASLAGQGIIYEVVQMSKLDAYSVGGCIHIAANNQIGFTTNYIDARSSIYCTDVAKVTKCPVFHVNGDDAEAIVHVMKIAMEYRQKFNSDVFIDLLGYRKYGHNEGDEPRFTQPKLYKAISKHPNPREIYSKKLLEQGHIEANLAKEMEKEFKAMLQEKLIHVKNDGEVESKNAPANTWAEIQKAKESDFYQSPNTAITKKLFNELVQKINYIPKDHQPIKKIIRIFEDRLTMAKDNKYDWAMGELMAYASLLVEGFPIRMSGQDCERGTFSHRHAVLKKEDSEQEFTPLQHLADDQAQFEIHNSLLSEFAVLGFEYGYAMAHPNALTLWEAQFGDFVNGAQVIIDQYISSGEAKWNRKNGLVMLLPHGYAGQGPEHSSARPERFLQLCANLNMQVVNCTTPANFFHVLRRQLKRTIRIPLIVMTPKGLLRHPKCISGIDEFTKSNFQEIYDDHSVKDARKLLFCSGKVYYDLLEYKETNKIKDVAIIRVEQLYPLPVNQIQEIFKKHPKATRVWVQEEPKNMGTWQHILRYEDLELEKLKVVCRKSSSSPATGYYNVHISEQNALIEEAFQ